MKSLILISKKPVVIQIFTLVCKQLHISLEVLHEAQVDHKVDIMVIDKDFIGDRFNILKSYCKTIGAVSKEELSFDIANDFLIPMPFIPSQLYKILDEQLELLDKRAKSKVYVSNVEVPDENEHLLDDYQNETPYAEDEFAIDTLNPKTPQTPPIDESENAVDYLESLADDIAFDMNEETDDSIVSMSSLNNGGVLDNNELSMIEDIINETTEEESKIQDMPSLNKEQKEDEWIDLSSIIDQAIDEVNMVDNVASGISSGNGPLKILINNYELEQLKPLLKLLDQNTIDTISEGSEVSLTLKLDNGR